MSPSGLNESSDRILFYDSDNFFYIIGVNERN